MKPIQNGIAPSNSGKLGVELNAHRRDMRSLAPRHVPGAYVSHTSEGVTFRPKPSEGEDGPAATNSIPRWG